MSQYELEFSEEYKYMYQKAEEVAATFIEQQNIFLPLVLIPKDKYVERINMLATEKGGLFKIKPYNGSTFLAVADFENVLDIDKVFSRFSITASELSENNYEIDKIIFGLGIQAQSELTERRIADLERALLIATSEPEERAQEASHYNWLNDQNLHLKKTLVKICRHIIDYTNSGHIDDRSGLSLEAEEILRELNEI